MSCNRLCNSSRGLSIKRHQSNVKYLRYSVCYANKAKRYKDVPYTVYTSYPVLMSMLVSQNKKEVHYVIQR